MGKPGQPPDICGPQVACIHLLKELAWIHDRTLHYCSDCSSAIADLSLMPALTAFGARHAGDGAAPSEPRYLPVRLLSGSTGTALPESTILGFAVGAGGCLPSR